MPNFIEDNGLFEYRQPCKEQLSTMTTKIGIVGILKLLVEIATDKITGDSDDKFWAIAARLIDWVAEFLIKESNQINTSSRTNLPKFSNLMSQKWMHLIKKDE